MIDPRAVQIVIDVIGILMLGVLLVAAGFDLWLEGRDESLRLH